MAFQTPPESPTTSHPASSRKGVLTYVPLMVAVFLILVPHPSFVLMLTSHYLKMLRLPVAFWTHLLAVNLLTLLVFSSLLACVVRDPGGLTPVSPRKPPLEDAGTALLEGEDQSIDMDEIKGDETLWCRRCELRRPERAHHCSTCDRCILKMDHHCPWLGGNCIGYRTYPSFVHFIFTATLLAAYITCVALSVVVRLISDPFTIDPNVTPLHSMFLVLMGAIFSLIMGSFFAYHAYLISTNQTTLEHLSPFFLLRHLPALPSPPDETSPSSRDPAAFSYPPPHNAPPPLKRFPPPPSSPRARLPQLSTTFADPPTPPPQQSPLESPLSPSLTTNNYPFLHVAAPPHTHVSPAPTVSSHRDRRHLEEHMLSAAQRRLVRYMHGRLRPYDIGFRANWAQVFGGGGGNSGRGRIRGDGNGRRRGWSRWIRLVLWGGEPCGDGRAFAHGPRVQADLERLARKLDDIRIEERR